MTYDMERAAHKAAENMLPQLIAANKIVGDEILALETVIPNTL